MLEIYDLPKVGKTVGKSDLIIDDEFLSCFASGTINSCKTKQVWTNLKNHWPAICIHNNLYATETKST